MRLADIGADHIALLRDTIEDAMVARASGGWPFAARIVGRDGTLLANAANAVASSGDPTAHAEIQAIRLAAANAADELAGSTLYASAEPCPMCAAAIHWAALGRVVFAVSEPVLRTLYGAAAPFSPLTLRCRDVIASGGTASVIGPLLEEEAMRPHQGFWTAGGPREAMS